MMATVSAAVRPSTTVDFVEEYAAAAERLAVAVAWSDLRAPVPGCPGWSAYDLVVHVGNVHAWAATIVETGRAAAEQNDEPSSSRAARGEQLVRRQGRGPLRGAARRGPGRPVLELRVRQRHEAVLAAAPAARDDHPPGRPRPDPAARTPRSSPPSAGTGSTRCSRVFLHRMHQRGHAAALDRPLAVTATDTGDTWVVSPAAPAGRDAAGARPGRRARPAEAVPDAPADRRAPALVPPAGGRGPGRGPAEVLYRLLWKPLDVDAADVRLSGDEQRVRGFLASRLVP